MSNAEAPIEAPKKDRKGSSLAQAQSFEKSSEWKSHSLSYLDNLQWPCKTNLAICPKPEKCQSNCTRCFKSYTPTHSTFSSKQTCSNQPHISSCHTRHFSASQVTNILSRNSCVTAHYPKSSAPYDLKTPWDWSYCFQDPHHNTSKIPSLHLDWTCLLLHSLFQHLKSRY